MSKEQQSQPKDNKPQPKLANSQNGQLGQQLLSAVMLSKVGQMDRLPTQPATRPLRQAHILQLQWLQGNQHVQRLLDQRQKPTLVVRPATVHGRTIQRSGLLTDSEVQSAIGYTERRYSSLSVRAIQQTASSPITGAFDEQTAQDVATFQDGHHGIWVDGKVGPQTLGKMVSPLAAAGNHALAIQLVVDFYNLDLSKTLTLRFDPALPAATAADLSFESGNLRVIRLGEPAFVSATTLRRTIQRELRRPAPAIPALTARPTHLTEAEEEAAIQYNQAQYTDSRSARAVQGIVQARPDAKFGPDTVQRIAEFQSGHSLTVNGQANEQTLEALVTVSNAAGQQNAAIRLIIDFYNMSDSEALLDIAFDPSLAGVKGRTTGANPGVSTILIGPEAFAQGFTGLVRTIAHELELVRQHREGIAGPAGTANFDLYRQTFNSLWNAPPYSTMSTTFDPSSSSKGPRTHRARAIFQTIYDNDAALKAAYDADTGGIRERIDTYSGPEGLNLINSPRLAQLEAAFTGFSSPVSAADYPAFRTAVQNAAANLDDLDRQAFSNSNEWQRLVNDYVTDDAKRAEIRGIIVPSIAPGPPPPTPTPTPTPAQQLATFIADWHADINFWDGARSNRWSSSSTVRYWGGTQNFEVGSSSSIANPGQVLFVRVKILRGATVIHAATMAQFPANQNRMSTMATPVSAPASVPATGDVLTFEVDLLQADRTTILKSDPETVTVLPEATYTQAQAEAAAAADQAHYSSNAPTGLLGKMTARGGVAANVAEAINAGRIRLRPLTQRHDSGTFVSPPDPSKVGYFVGADYSESFTGVAGAAAFSLGSAGSGNIVVNRTTDVSINAKRSDDSIIMLVVHEAVHNMDKRPTPGTDIERYKTEFRAYWMDGRYGPPHQGTCPSPPGSCLSTAYDPSMSPPGPKAPRARAIFDHLYGSATYPFVQPAYDNNTSGFRVAVDNYLIPDGINLIASIRLDDLQAFIEGWAGADFPAFRSEVRRYLGVGAAPTNGVLTADERDEISNNRMWRDLIERKVLSAAQQVQIKTDLGIPR